MRYPIRIGTRESELALWQAKTVKEQLETLGHSCELVLVKSTGDVVLDKPLYELGITGIFTRTLDLALLEDKIDVAVHSMKDVPTILPKQLLQAAVLKRGITNDVLIHKQDLFEPKDTMTIATGSLRRKAQWLHRYPDHTMVPIRGNVNSRLKKLEEHPWDGAIFAQAGLERINLMSQNSIALNWMLPAPAQGAIMLVSHEQKSNLLNILHDLNDAETELCTGMERAFLRTLEGGCTAPIAALATIKEQSVYFKGMVLSLTGEQCLDIEKKCPMSEAKGLGEQCANEILANGGKELMQEIKNDLA